MNTTFDGLNVTSMENSTAEAANAVVSQPVPWQELAFSSIGAFGVLTNLVCYIVFMSPTLKDQTYTCMMVYCLVDLVYLLMQTFMILFSCGSLCAERANSWIGKAYFLYGIFYFTSCLSIYSILMVIYVSIQRCLLILNNKFLTRIPCKYILTGLLLAIMILNSQLLFAMYVVERTKPDGSVIYTFSLTQFAFSAAYDTISQANKIVRIVLVIVILPAINIILIILFKRHFEKKRRLNMTTNTSTHRTNQGEFHLLNLKLV